MEPRIFEREEESSALDAGYELYKTGRLGIWDSVRANSQTSGRGQMRRHWDSPAGNIYAALRLPLEGVFKTSACALATAELAAWALERVAENQCDLWIKWPNDLVVMANGHYAKVGGILLEERGECLLAGIGINLQANGIRTREDTALPAGSLAGFLPGGFNAGCLWRRLVNLMFESYNSGHFLSDWRDSVISRLLWRDSPVEVIDGEHKSTGILLGVNLAGCAILAGPDGETEICCGSMAARV